MNRLALLVLLLTTSAGATYVPGLDVSGGYSVFIITGSCPAGFTEDTGMRGFYPVGLPSGQTIGSSVGTAASGAATLPSATGASFSYTGTNMVTTAGTTPTFTVFNGTTLAAGSQTANIPSAAILSTTMAIKYGMWCKKT